MTLGEGLLGVRRMTQRCLDACKHLNLASLKPTSPSDSKTLTGTGAEMLLREACGVCQKYLPVRGNQLMSCTNQSPPVSPGTPVLLATLTLNAREKGPLGLMSTFLFLMHPGE